jgi:hypothetical protein
MHLARLDLVVVDEDALVARDRVAARFSGFEQAEQL